MNYKNIILIAMLTTLNISVAAPKYQSPVNRCIANVIANKDGSFEEAYKLMSILEQQKSRFPKRTDLLESEIASIKHVLEQCIRQSFKTTKKNPSKENKHDQKNKSCRAELAADFEFECKEIEDAFLENIESVSMNSLLRDINRSHLK